VIHVITQRLEDYTPMLHSVGQMDFPHRTAPADGAKGGAPDPRDKKERPAHGAVPMAGRSVPDETIRVKSRNFH
jgi:hypothetical protein